MSNTIDKPEWPEKARQARVLLEGPVEHGRKSARLAMVAKDLGLSRGTLDNYLDALKAYEALMAQAPDLGPRLEGQSAAAMAALGRWSGYDLAGLRRFLEGSEKPSLRQVLAAERAARPGQGQTGAEGFAALIEKSHAVPPRQRPEALWSMPAGALASTLEAFGAPDLRLLDLDWGAALPDYAAAIGLSRLGTIPPDAKRHHYGRTRFPVWTGEDEALPLVGVIEVPARDREEQYRREARLLWLRAVAAGTLVPVVILFFPDAAARAAAALNLPEPPAVWSSKVEAGAGAAAPLRSSRQDQDMPLRTIVPLDGRGGRALLTTPATLFDDWAGRAPEPQWRQGLGAGRS